MMGSFDVNQLILDVTFAARRLARAPKETRLAPCASAQAAADRAVEAAERAESYFRQSLDLSGSERGRAVNAGAAFCSKAAANAANAAKALEHLGERPAAAEMQSAAEAFWSAAAKAKEAAR